MIATSNLSPIGLTKLSDVDMNGRVDNKVCKRVMQISEVLSKPGSDRIKRRHADQLKLLIRPLAMDRLIKLLSENPAICPLVYSSIPVGWSDLLVELLEALLSERDRAIDAGWRLELIHYGAKFGGLTMRFNFSQCDRLRSARMHRFASGEITRRAPASHAGTAALQAHRSAVTVLIEQARRRTLNTCALCGTPRVHGDGFRPSLCGHHTLTELKDMQSLFDDLVLSGVDAMRNSQKLSSASVFEADSPI